jgi:NAD+ diphosphatase
VEPGESLEGAVVREVFEETSIRIKRVVYHSSQPWPFPSSIMLGFTAEGGTERIELGDHELEDARWLTRDAVVQGLKAGALRLPTRISIAFRLIEDWFDAGGPPTLDSVLKTVKKR